MKRLFACIGLSLLSALTIVFYFGIFGSVFLLVMAVGIMGAGLFLKKYADNRSMLVTVAVVLVLGCAYSNLYTGLYFIPQSEAYDGQTVTIEAKVEAPPYHNYSYCYDLSTTEIDGEQKNIKLLLKTPNQLDIDYQDTIKCTVNLTKCDNDYYKSKGYLYTAKSENYYLEYEVEKAETRDFLYYTNQVKESLLHSISTVIPGEEGQLSRAVALGDKYVMSGDLRRSFSNSGLSYLIVVSGLHMSILAGFVLMLFRKAPATIPFIIIKSVILIVLILSFMLITGLSPSVVRSGIMIVITFLGSLFRRKSDSLNSLGVAAIVLTVLNPYAVGDVGLLFSFASVVGIIVIYPKIMNYIDSKLGGYNTYRIVERYIFDPLSLSFSCVLCVTPISLMYFGTCNPLVFIVSLFVTALISVLLICTLFCAVLWLVPFLQGFAYAFGLISYFVGKAVILIVNISGKIPFTKITADPSYVRPFLLVFILSVGIAMLFKNRAKLLKYVVTIFMIVAVLSWGCVRLINYDKHVMSVYNTGDGLTAVIRQHGKCVVLSCGGDTQFTTDTINRLNYSNDKISMLVVPSTSGYDSRYAREILTEFDVEAVMLYYKYTTNEKVFRLAKECKNCYKFTNGDEITVNLPGGVKDRIICNSNRSWQYVYNKNVSVLFAPKNGDVKAIPKKYRSADVLVASSELRNYNLLRCDNIVWTSSKEVPKYYLNAVSVTDGTVDINFD